MAEYSLPDLPYDYAALEPHVSGQIMELHHDKHHAAYVTGANQTLEKLAGARDKDDFGAIVGLEKTLAFHISGHVLHSIFWKNLSPDGGDKPDGALSHGHRRELRLVRQVQGPPDAGDLDDPGLGLGCAGLRAAGRPAHRRAGLRPPGQRRQRVHPAARLRRLGARLLPAVQEREGRLLQGAVEHRQLVRRGGSPRLGQGAEGRRLTAGPEAAAAGREVTYPGTGAARTPAGLGLARGRHRGRVPAGLALPVGAVAQELERAVDAVEHGGRPGQFGLVALLHEGQGSAGAPVPGAHPVPDRAPVARSASPRGGAARAEARQVGVRTPAQGAAEPQHFVV